MDNALKGLFGGGTADSSGSAPDARAQAHDFIQRVTTGDQTQGYTDDEAHAAVQHVMQHANPDTMNRALTQSVNNLSEEQRGQFAQMLQQRQAQGRTSGTPGADGGPIIQQSSGDGQTAGGTNFGEVLGGLLGGGGLFGSLFGGASGSGQAQTQPGAATGQAQSQGGGMGTLGEIMSSPIGKAVLVGAAAFAMKEMMGHK